jgi:uncharacterized protein (DUF1330 family)
MGTRKGYVIVHAQVVDPVRWQAYAAAAAQVIASYGGRALVRGGRYELAEGRTLPRTVLLEFESYERARQYLFSTEYAAARRLREGAGTMDAQVVEGVETAPEPNG